jgi:glycyl-tRNA synthetase
MEIEYFINPDQLDECPLFSELKDVELAIVTREAQQEAAEKDSTEYSSTRVTVEEAYTQGIVPNKWMACVLGNEMAFIPQLGIPKEALRFRHMRPEETPHYSGGNFDLEIKLSIGWKEVIGNAYRRDHDLQAHMKGSQKDLSIDIEGSKVVPHVIEPSFGIERLLYCILEHTYRPKDEERGWTWFQFPPQIAPFDAVILPLLKRTEIQEPARHLYKKCQQLNLAVLYDEGGRIGRRYARADEIGIPSAITIDPQTMEDETVTLRSRDTAKQTRHPLETIPSLLQEMKQSKGF